jgi:hypothetical protein
MNSGVSTATAAVVAVVAYVIGYAHAVTRRALADWKSNKAGMREKRKLFFLGLWRLTWVGTIAVVLAAGLLFWLVRDVEDGNRRTPLVPPRATTPSPSASR